MATPITATEILELRLEILKELVGLDFTDLDAKRKATFDDRTAVNREVKSTKARFEAAPIHEIPEETPGEPVNVAGLMEELEKAQGRNQVNDETMEQFKNAGEAILAFKGTVKDIEDKIAALQQDLKVEKHALAISIENHARLKEETENLTYADTSIVKDRIANAQATNDAIRDKATARAAMVRENAARKALKAEWDDKKKESEVLTAALDAIDKSKAGQLANASFPIPDLSFDETGVTFEGLPFSQASQAQRIRVSIATGFALNPRLKVLIVRDASLLDAKNLALVEGIAKEFGGKVWLERVGDKDKAAIIIEDGHVRAAE